MNNHEFEHIITSLAALVTWPKPIKSSSVEANIRAYICDGIIVHEWQETLTSHQIDLLEALHILWQNTNNGTYDYSAIND